MPTTSKPARMPNFSFPWKKVKASKDPEIAMDAASPISSWKGTNASFGSPSHRFNDWMPSQNTDSSESYAYGSIGSPRSDCSRKALSRSPPPAYESPAMKLQSRMTHDQEILQRIGLFQNLVDSAAMTDSPTAHQLSPDILGQIPFELSTRKSSLSPQLVVTGSVTDDSIPSNKAQASSRCLLTLPPIDTQIAFSARTSPVPAAQSSYTTKRAKNLSASSSPLNSDPSASCSDYTSPSSLSSMNDEFQSPVTVFQTEGQCWVFPNVAITEAIAQITSDSIRVETLTDHDGSGTYPGSQSASNDSSPTSANTSSPTGPGNKRRRNGGRGNQKAKSARQQLGHSTKTRSQPLKYGCPFAKHNPERYSGVFNSCTTGPGIDWKYLIEHLTRVHNASARCIYCNEVWSTPNWERELQNHHETGACSQRDKILSKPEAMTADQERVYKDTNELGHPDKRWVSLFMRLFPNSWPIPNPRYNYYVARHRIITPISSNSSSPTSAGTGAPPQTRTWYVFSRNTGEDGYDSPDPSPNQDTGGIFSTGIAQANQVGFPAPLLPFGTVNTAMPLGETAHYGAGGWADPPLLDEHVWGLGDANFGDDSNALVMPAGDASGHDLLQKWVGQNVPENVHVNALSMF